jgi:mRNA interferase RelE/StbE
LSEYRIFETDEFTKRLGKFPAEKRAFLQRKLTVSVYPQLRAMPYYGPNIRKLAGYEPETWRYRIGRFRVFYMVSEDAKTVYILSVDDRKDAYRR